MRVLNVEDSEADSALIWRELRKAFAGVELVRVDTPEALDAALAAGPWDLVIADHKLPRLDSMTILGALRASGTDVPVIVVSGSMGHAFAVEAMRAGARDYLVKGELVRLNSAVARELRDAERRRLGAARQALSGEVLGLLAEKGELVPHLQAALERLALHAGAEAAAIRVRAGTDTPYLAHIGVAPEVLEDEQALAAHYQSLALVPLRSEDDLVGLLQLAARAPGRFDADLVRFLEELAPSLGLAIDRRRSQEALRVSEERYRVLVETSPNGVALCALDGTVLKANGRLAALLGLDPGSLEGRRLGDLVADGDRARAEAELAALVASERPRELVLRFRRGEGVFDGEATAARTSRDASRAALVFIVRDVTEQLRLRASLAQSDRLASIGMLAAGVAHEINNPLSYVLCNLESLLADLPGVEAALPSNPDRLELGARAAEALEGARRIREIVRDLKVFSRSGSDRREHVSVNEVMKGAVNMTRNEVKYRARLVASYGEVPPVLASEGRLAQVFLNLLVNAAQAIGEGGLDRNTISVKTSADGDWVRCEVRDTGVGMSPEVQARLFEPFFTTKPSGVGTGLGLAISRGIVEEAGGRIEVESHAGEGTRFVVALPAAAAAVAPAPRPPELPAVVEGRRGRVLVVDDEAFVRAAVRRLLRSEHDVVEAEDGAAAARRLASDAGFDVILCDVLMPEATGVDLYEQLLATRPELAARIVFMTGGVFTERTARVLESLANLRIEKPIDGQTLRQLVRALVAARGAR